MLTPNIRRIGGAAGLVSLLFVALSLCAPAAMAQVDKVTTYRDSAGWKLKVNGEDYYVKGVVWGYSPRGQNYTYNLWGESDDFIRKVLDYDFGLMKAAGINTVRSFAMIPPRWITYIYREHGIMTVVNPLMGRYGYSVGGKWVPFTDYSDPLTRETLKRDMADIVRQYKDTPGVLMFAFGNESNYGLSWSSFEIENLPVGEQQTAKARFLYSLFNEVIEEGKAIDGGNHPFTIVNGDIQYIDLIAELCPELDILGSNVYRGPSFTSLWAEVKEKLGLPVIFFEFGSDAFNARRLQEDQLAQALQLRSQWQEMYNKSYGQGEEGNAIGAFVFEWRDEWWKYLQIENLDIHDTNASWSNQAYLFDWAEGQNNMNEEWFGITALGLPNSDGVYTARPRMAYDVLAEVFRIDPYTASKRQVNQTFANLDLDMLELKGEVRALKESESERRRMVRMTGGDIRGEFVLRGLEQDIRELGEEGIQYTDGQMVNADFAFSPTENIDGQFSLNVLAGVADKQPLEFEYGQRGLPLTVSVPTQVANTFVDTDQFEPEFVERTIVFEDRERVEIYDFSMDYRGELFDMEVFYHTPRFHLGYEGDFFSLVSEATDIPGIDTFNGKAPEGVEFEFKGPLKGLKIIAGPEIYWGANPKALVKYDFGLGRTDFTIIHSEDVSRLGQGANATQATLRQSRQSTIYSKTPLPFGMTLEAGAILSAPERIDEQFDRIDDNGNIVSDQIEFVDTLGLKARLTIPFRNTEWYLHTHQAGLVAESPGAPVRPTFGVTDPSEIPLSGLGNKRVYEIGSLIRFGSLLITPRFFYRDNIVDANPLILPTITPDGILNPGVVPRDRDGDPFAVLDNRAARSAEIYFTWDPTGETPFYDWDNTWRENAKFAFDIGATYTDFPTATDANLFFFEEGAANASFGQGLPAENVWTVKSRMVFNPSRKARYILTLRRGRAQPTGNPAGGTREFYSADIRATLQRRHLIQGFFRKNDFGPEDFFRQFNFTYPEQFQLDYAFLMGGVSSNAIDELRSTRIGVRGILRTLDENSLPQEYQDGRNSYNFLTTFYFTYRF